MEKRKRPVPENKLTEFLSSGGFLLRIKVNRNGDVVIQKRRKDSKWQAAMICISIETASGIVHKLCNEHPSKFKMI